MSEEIKAALTAEEWEHAPWRATVPLLGGSVTAQLGDTSLMLCRDGRREMPSVDTYEEVGRHRLAALALYGQPYGFTWEMVDALESAASRLERDLGLTDEYTVACSRAIACIAALLPPRSP